MKILVFTEGTILMHSSARDVSREERVKQSKQAGIQREERNLAYNTNTTPSPVEPGSVYDFKSQIPVGDAVIKLINWKQQGASLVYFTSRRIKSEIEAVQNVLKNYHFPDYKNLYFRQQGEDYKDVAEKLIPDILIEDDCESIGGEKEMTYPHISPELKKKIKSIVVKEFEGIDNLPTDITKLKSFICF